MQQYILRRLLLAIPTLLLVSVVIFTINRLIPGDVILSLLGEGGRLTPEELERARRELGLDKPLPLQYWDWISGFLVLDLGNSLFDGRPVVEHIMLRFPITFELAILAMFVAIFISIPLGVISALKQDGWMDYASRLFAIAGLSLPLFWLATLAILFPAVWWGLSPPLEPTSFFKQPTAHLYQFLVPAFILGYRLSATNIRMLRSTMLEVLRDDYIRTARAKGLQERVVVMRHALKNASIPVVTIMGTQLAFTMGSSVIIETVFGLPGTGKLVVDAILLRDYTVVQGTVMLFAVIMILMNLVVDLTYGWLDPRIRYN